MPVYILCIYSCCALLLIKAGLYISKVLKHEKHNLHKCKRAMTYAKFKLSQCRAEEHRKVYVSKVIFNYYYSLKDCRD